MGRWHRRMSPLAAGLGTALHAAGLPVGPDRCERLAGAVVVMQACSVADLRACALATMVSVAYRIVWANPRTQSPRYRPEVGGMAAAWPYCAAVVSAHNLDAIENLLAAFRAR